MGLVGTAIGIGLGAFGRKPEIPELPTINPTDISQATVKGNAQTLPGATQLGMDTNRANIAATTDMLNQALPGSFDLAKRNTDALLRGEIPDDVSRSVDSTAAAQAFSGGFAGGGAQRALTLRDLGLTSLQLQQTGFQQFQGLASMFPKPFDVTSMFFTPQQRLDHAVNERNLSFSRQLLQNQVSAAPDPSMVALTQAIMQEEDSLMEMLGSMLGSGGSGSGGGGGGGLGGLIGGLICWVARSVFGPHDIRWRIFRLWLLKDAPPEFRACYIERGAECAQRLKRRPDLRAALLAPMQSIVNNYLLKHYGARN